MCCADDDVGDGGRNTDFDTRIALFGQLPLEELVELGIEDAVCYELATLGDVHAARGGRCGLHAGLLLGDIL